MKVPCITNEYDKGVEDFLQFAQQNAPEMGGKYFCPCVKSLHDIRSHLICKGISHTYTKWI